MWSNEVLLLESRMARVKDGDIVRVVCAGRLVDGREFEMAPDGGAIEIIVGHGDLLPELEQAVVGMAPGESRVVIVPKDKGYGPRREDLVQVISRDDFPEGIVPKVGQRLRLPGEDYEVLRAVVTKVTETEITVDANHPLAGQDVLFKLTLLEIVEL
jgi:peptidylprolyl isomerase